MKRSLFVWGLALVMSTAMGQEVQKDFSLETEIVYDLFSDDEFNQTMTCLGLPRLENAELKPCPSGPWGSAFSYLYVAMAIERDLLLFDEFPLETTEMSPWAFQRWASEPVAMSTSVDLPVESEKAMRDRLAQKGLSQYLPASKVTVPMQIFKPFTQSVRDHLFQRFQTQWAEVSVDGLTELKELADRRDQAYAEGGMTPDGFSAKDLMKWKVTELD